MNESCPAKTHLHRAEHTNESRYVLPSQADSYVNELYHSKTHSYKAENAKKSRYVRSLIRMSHVLQRLI